MRPLDLSYLRGKQEFQLFMSITQKMGLHHLMGIQCDYHEYYVQQFLSTLAFKNDEAITMQWLTGEEQCEANFYDFSEVLGYDFDGNTPVGSRVHGLDHPDKTVLDDMFDFGQPTNLTAGLLPLYSQLVNMFRMNIAPSGGNNDAIRASLINLLYFSYEVANDPNPGQHNRLDVMDYIYREMFDAMVSKHSIPYAPYIWMLIKRTAKTLQFRQRDLVEHRVKKPYVSKAKPTPPVVQDSFMGDARGRTSAKIHKPTLKKEVKQLSWFQKYMLCMNVEIHKEQYRAHNERLDILHNQAVLLHHVKHTKGHPLLKSLPLPSKIGTDLQILTGLRLRSSSKDVQKKVLHRQLPHMMMMIRMMMTMMATRKRMMRMMTPMTPSTTLSLSDHMGRVASLFFLFGVLMPKGEKQFYLGCRGFARVGHKCISFFWLYLRACVHLS